jgi:hypothetical protein
MIAIESSPHIHKMPTDAKEVMNPPGMNGEGFAAKVGKSRECITIANAGHNNNNNNSSSSGKNEYEYKWQFRMQSTWYDAYLDGHFPENQIISYHGRRPAYNGMDLSMTAVSMVKKSLIAEFCTQGNKAK